MYKKGLYAIAALVGIFLLGLIGYIIILFLGNYVIDEKKIVMDSATRLVDENGDELTKLLCEKIGTWFQLIRFQSIYNKHLFQLKTFVFMNTTESILNLLAEHYTEIYWLEKC